ncbi:MAG: hypothetical protein WBD95_18870 [Xanthobacteraceae bacterium]
MAAKQLHVTVEGIRAHLKEGLIDLVALACRKTTKLTLGAITDL